MLQSHPICYATGKMERGTGIEPVTSSLGSSRSTAELTPLNCRLCESSELLSISSLPISLAAIAHHRLQDVRHPHGRSARGNNAQINRHTR